MITSWDREALVGIARTLTDFTVVASLAGLAVDLVYQKKGIGREFSEEHDFVWSLRARLY